MTREELLGLRNSLMVLVTARRALGDFDVNSAAIRACLEANLKLTQHLIDRMRTKE